MLLSQKHLVRNTWTTIVGLRQVFTCVQPKCHMFVMACHQSKLLVITWS